MYDVVMKVAASDDVVKYGSYASLEDAVHAAYVECPWKCEVRDADGNVVVNEKAVKALRDGLPSGCWWYGPR